MLTYFSKRKIESRITAAPNVEHIQFRRLFPKVFNPIHAPKQLVLTQLINAGVSTITRLLRGGIKKCFFCIFFVKLRSPPPPFLTSSFFSDKIFWIGQAPPPPLNGENVKKNLFFGPNWSKDFLDWLRSAPPS